MKGNNGDNNLIFRHFIVLWALSILFFQGFSNQWSYIGLTLLSLLVVFRPKLWLFLSLIIFQGYTIYLQLPNVPNILMFSLFVDITIILTVVLEICSSRSLRLSGNAIYRKFAPVVRLEVILLYFFAFFHKLNYDFFQVESSCVTFLTGEIRDIFPLVPDSSWFIYSLIIGTLAIEGGIPLLLAFRKTRVWGLCLGFVFHFFLARSHYDFSAVIFALYGLFLPQSFIQAMYHKARELSKRFPARFLEILQSTGFMLVVIVLFLWVVSLLKYMVSYQAFLVAWGVWAMIYLFLFTLVMLEKKFRLHYKPHLFHCPAKILLLVPLLVFLNGLSPYLGLKTENSFSMYSNLRTEGGATNHMIITRPLLLANYQTDLVYIHSSNDKDLQKFAQTPNPITYYDFKKLILNKIRTGKTEITLTFSRQGEKVQVCNLRDLKIHQESIPYLKKKFLIFRPIQLDDCVTCVH